MSFEAQKITAAQIAAAGVQSQPNKLTGTAAQNKAVFDALTETVVMTAFNALIDELLSAGAAAQLGVDTVTGITADTVQEALEALAQSMRDITQGSVADGSIGTEKLAAGSVTAAKIAALAVTSALLAAGAVTNEKLADGAVSTAKIAALAVTTALLADGSVTTDKLASLSVTGAKIANTAVDSTKLAAGAVTTVKLADLAVTAAKLAALSVTTEKLAALSVTAEKIDDGAVTAAKLGEDVNYASIGLAGNQVRAIYIGTETPTAETLAEGEIYLQVTAGEEA